LIDSLTTSDLKRMILQEESIAHRTIYQGTPEV
jgi:hypothetical protein